jgi:uncharacterized protein (TIGR03382 family)
MFGVVLSFSVIQAQASTPPPIVGGVETDELPAVAALVGVKSGRPLWVVCTVTLIDPHVALTAAHCLEAAETYLPDGYNFELRFGADAEQPISTIGVDDWVRAPDEVDMGLLFLAEPAQTSPLTPLADQLIHSEDKELATLVGYGKTGSDNGDSGIKRSVQLFVEQLDEDEILFLEYPEQLGACGGDSGGPVLLERDGQWVPVAVMVRIFDYDGDGEACGDLTVGVMVYPLLAWIQEEVAAVQPEPEPEPEDEDPQVDPPEEEAGRFGCSSVSGGSSLTLAFGLLALLFLRRRN